MKNAKGNHLEGTLHLNKDAGDPLDDVTELHYKVNGEPLGYARHKLPEATWLMPGQSTRALLTFIWPAPILPSLGVGHKLDAYRGTRKIGTLDITDISASPLKGSIEGSEKTQVESQLSGRTSDIVAISIVYLIFAGLTVYFAIKAYTPCDSNFEGGCGMGRDLMAIVSLVPAAMASIFGVLVKRRMDKSYALALRIAPAHNLLWIVPLIYILTTVRALFGG